MHASLVASVGACLGAWVDVPGDTGCPPRFLESDPDQPTRWRLCATRPAECPIGEWRCVGLLRAVHASGAVALPAPKSPEHASALRLARRAVALLDNMLKIDVQRNALLLNPDHCTLALLLKRVASVALASTSDTPLGTTWRELTLTELRTRYSECFLDEPLPITAGLAAALPLITKMAVLPLDATYQRLGVSSAGAAVASACLVRLTRLTLQQSGKPVDAQPQLDALKTEWRLDARHPLTVAWLHVMAPLHAPLLEFACDYQRVRSTHSGQSVVAAVLELLQKRASQGASASELNRLVLQPARLLKPALDQGTIVARVDKDTDVRYYWLGSPAVSTAALRCDPQLDLLWTRRQALDPTRYSHRSIRQHLLGTPLGALDARAWNRQTGPLTLPTTATTATPTWARTGPTLQSQQQRRRQQARHRRQRDWLRSASQKTTS